jgi:YHS domain-containing protein
MKVKDSVCGRTISLDDVYATIEHDGAIHCFCSRQCWQRFVDEHAVCLACA